MVSQDSNTVKSVAFNDCPAKMIQEIDWHKEDHVEMHMIDVSVNCILNSDATTDFTICTLYITRSLKSYNIKVLAKIGIKKIYYGECRRDIHHTKELCRIFMIELIKYEPHNQLTLGSGEYIS